MLVDTMTCRGTPGQADVAVWCNAWQSGTLARQWQAPGVPKTRQAFAAPGLAPTHLAHAARRGLKHPQLMRCRQASIQRNRLHAQLEPAALQPPPLLLQQPHSCRWAGGWVGKEKHNRISRLPELGLPAPGNCPPQHRDSTLDYASPQPRHRTLQRAQALPHAGTQASYSYHAAPSSAQQAP